MTLPSSISVAARTSPAAFCVFDVLVHGREDVRSLPLSERQRRLEQLVETRPGVQRVTSLEEHGEALFAQACELDMEGIVGKDLSAPYKRGVQKSWVKMKNPNSSRAEALGFQR